MSITQTYAGLIQQLNSHIETFNAFLVDHIKLRLISETDPTTYSEVQGKAWGDWPSKDFPGVYVICGRDASEPARIAAYVGKASFQKMGFRIHPRLLPFRRSGLYKVGGAESAFVLEVILAIPFRHPTPCSMAAALEEYIIAQGLKNVSFLNTIGKRG